METFQHDLPSLFSQLGLDNSTSDINNFIFKHKLSSEILLADAPFWSPAQRSFLVECQQQDADWCEIIDQLDVLLRK